MAMIHYSLRDGKYKPVVLKSQEIPKYIEEGMTPEEAEDFWCYNMEGSDSILIAVDDTLEDEEVDRILQEQQDEHLWNS